MKVAVTYDHGMIFQHFGKTERFKIYTIENNRLTGFEIVDSNGQGHGALANVLASYNIDALICGGIGQGAMNALNALNIDVYGGNEGDCDMVINRFINGQLEMKCGTCSHHDHEAGHSCSGHCCS